MIKLWHIEDTGSPSIGDLIIDNRGDVAQYDGLGAFLLPVDEPLTEQARTAYVWAMAGDVGFVGFVKDSQRIKMRAEATP